MYRKDGRTLEQFKEDIKACTKTERDLMNLYLEYLNKSVTDGNYYYYLDNGVDNTGEFIEDNKKITSEADFLLCKIGKPNRKIEIKFCKPDRPVFHLKISHMKRCIKEDVCVVNWMSVDNISARRFCILTPKKLEHFLNNGYHTKMWFKPCVRIKNAEIEWIQK